MADKPTPPAEGPAADQRIAALREALKPFALNVASSFHDDDTWTMYFKVGDIRRARQVYEAAASTPTGS